MNTPARLCRLVVLGATAVAVGCGSNPRAQLPEPVTRPARAAVAAPATVPVQPVVDPVDALIASSDRHFEAGQQELALGHLVRARLEFDQALDVLIDSPYGGRNNEKIRGHFDRLVDRISALEVTALAVGDGFTEQQSVPASIDELLATSAFDTLPAPPELERTVRADLESNQHDIPIPLNPRVLAYVEQFQGRLREWVTNGLSRGTQYLPMIQSVFRAEGLPLDLAYIPLIESAFKPSALSRAKAKGVWQFMKDTAVENGLKHDWFIDERADPEKATRAAAKYLKTLGQMFDGDWNLALASYNGGPGRVQRAMRRSRSNDFWEMSASTRYLPRETREYVPMILAAIIIARNPAQYGFEIEPQAAAAYETVEVPRAVDLRRVAEWTGTSIDDIQALNPELRRWTTPVRYPDYAVKVPVGTGDVLRERLASAQESELSALKFYAARRGDTMAGVARRFGVARADLAGANGLSVKARLQPGQQLLIPRAPAPLLARSLDRPEPRADVVQASRDLGGAAVEPSATEPEAASRITYRVKRGDTLFSIARLYETTVDALKQWNRLRGSRISPGDRLTIYRTN
jgi:membrane-bound lytic murein transglycosylase D